jgi:hypothetical protein
MTLTLEIEEAPKIPFATQVDVPPPVSSKILPANILTLAIPAIPKELLRVAATVPETWVPCSSV